MMAFCDAPHFGGFPTRSLAKSEKIFAEADSRRSQIANNQEGSTADGLALV
jgi:hypothetical protein